MYLMCVSPETEFKKIELDSVSLQDLQKAVGGFIEIVDTWLDMIAVCNEEGRLDHLPVNTFASAMCGQVMVGTVVFARTEGEDIVPFEDDFDFRSYIVSEITGEK